MEDYRVKFVGGSHIMTFSELDRIMRQTLEDEIVDIDNRLCEVLLVHLHNKNDTRATYSKSMGKMPVKDALNKFN